MQKDQQKNYNKLQQAIDESIADNVLPDKDFRRILDQQVALKVNERIAEQRSAKQKKSGLFPRGKWHISFATVLAGFFLFGGVVLAAVPGLREAVVETVSPTHGKLIVESEPNEADVSITQLSNSNLDKVSKTPLEINLPAGSYEVRIEKEGYTSKTIIVTIVTSETTTINETLDQDTSGELALSTAYQLTPFSSTLYGITFSYPDTWEKSVDLNTATFTDEGLTALLLVDTAPDTPIIPIEKTQNISIAGQIITVNTYLSDSEVIVLTSTPIRDSSREYYFTFSLPPDFDTQLILSILESVQLVIPLNQDNSEGPPTYDVSATAFFDDNGNGIFDANESIAENIPLEIVALNVPVDPQEVNGQLEYFYPSAEGTSVYTQTGIAEFTISDERDTNIYKAFAIKRVNGETYFSIHYRDPGFGDVAFPLITDISQTSTVEIPFYTTEVDGGLSTNLYNAEVTIDFFIDENGNDVLDTSEEIITNGIANVHLLRTYGFGQYSRLDSEGVVHISNLPYGTYSLQYKIQPNSSEDYIVSNIPNSASSLIQNDKISIRLVPGEQAFFHISIPVKF